MIVVHNLTRRFGKVVAVDSINFRIPRGRVVGFLGPNGAGKTTTIRMIAGFLRPTAGSVTVDGLDVARQSRAVRRRIGYLPESGPLYGEMRVQEYLRFRTRLYGIERSRRRGLVERAQELCSLGEVRRRPIGQLSRGFRQRVGLAAALVHEPPVLILDEPSAGLDPGQMRELRELIRRLAGRHTVLLSTHILSEVELSCDEVLMIAQGRVRMQASVEALRGSDAGGLYVVETDWSDAPDALRALPSIASVEASVLGDGWTRLFVSAAADADDRRELIGRTIKKQGGAIRELRREAPSLEQLFVQSVSGAGESGGAAGAPRGTEQPA